jgi:GNAT superfamily N-acetyltransferase
VTDEQKLTDLFYSLSNDTIYRRWMTAKKRLPHRDALYYLDVDYQNAMAIVLETHEEGREPEMIGVGRYHVDRATNFAEVAFLIRDAWQGKGLGTLLLQHLIRIARDKGIAGFTASVLATNRGMLHVFHRAGLEMTTRLEDGVYELTMGFGGSSPKSVVLHNVAQKFVGEDGEDVEEGNG